MEKGTISTSKLQQQMNFFLILAGNATSFVYDRRA